jgi:hypothetical protein
MKQIIHRSATSDFNAQLTAQGMTNASCEVFSITYNPHKKAYDDFRWSVWGKFDDAVTDLDAIDDAIEKCLYPKE